MSIDLFDWQVEVFLERKEKFILLPAGRRVGKTYSGARGVVLAASQEKKCLWVDTIYSNIDRYYQRYFMPFLESLPVEYKWNSQKKLLEIDDGYIDFRSADRPESLEGFGYDAIFLNEAGIILNNDYLYTNAILPMLMDHEESQLYAFGTPKGKFNKKGEEHKFYTLWKSWENQDPNYYGMQLSSYSNPTLNAQNVLLLEDEIRKLDPAGVDQEIYAEFIEQSEGSLFQFNDFNYYQGDELNLENVDGVYAYIDVADQGTDNLVMVIGYLVGDKVYIHDVIVTKEGTSVTKHTCTEMAERHNVNAIWVESNSMGSIFAETINEMLYDTQIIKITNSTNKHTRILSNAFFVKERFYFRKDYKALSDYDKYMKGMRSYNKDPKKNKHDDEADATSGLGHYIKKSFNHLFKAQTVSEK